jgi:hypothetical protein
MIGKHFGKSLTQSWAQADRDGILHFTQLAIPFLVEKGINIIYNNMSGLTMYFIIRIAVDTIGVFSLTKDVNEVQRIKQKIDQGIYVIIVIGNIIIDSSNVLTNVNKIPIFRIFIGELVTFEQSSAHNIATLLKVIIE